MVIRYVTSRRIGDLKDTLGRNVKKDLRQKIYDKIIKLGVRTTDNMSMAGLTQLSMEGVEQLDLYYSAYIPQFFLCDDLLLSFCLSSLYVSFGLLHLYYLHVYHSFQCPLLRYPVTQRRSLQSTGVNTHPWEIVS